MIYNSRGFGFACIPTTNPTPFHVYANYDMHWLPCSASASGVDSPLGRFGHTAVPVDARDVWGTELVVVFGGVVHSTGDAADQHTALSDVLVLQVEADAWFVPDMHGAVPEARAFHSAAAVGSKVYVFGGHVLQFDADHNKKRRIFFSDIHVLDIVSGCMKSMHEG